LELPEEEIKALAKKLKALCGTGGTAKEGVIEIQGDHRETLLAALSTQFKNVKLAGG
jgi:translation initiation factor 1